MKREKLIEVVESYLLGLHVQANDVLKSEYSRGWRGATKELVGSIKDKEGYVSKELGLK